MLSRAQKIITGLRRNPLPKPPRRPPPRRKHPAADHQSLKSLAGNNPSAALRRLLSSPSPSYPLCASLLYRLARARHFPLLDALLRHVRSRRVPVPNSLFSALIRHFSRNSLPREALRLFLAIPSFNCPRKSPSLHSFNCLLDALVGNGWYEEARSVLYGCGEFGLRANVVSYNIVMKGRLGRDGVDGAREVFDEMCERGVEPSVVSYNMLIGFAGMCSGRDCSVQTLDGPEINLMSSSHPDPLE